MAAKKWRAAAAAAPAAAAVAAAYTQTTHKSEWKLNTLGF